MRPQKGKAERPRFAGRWDDLARAIARRPERLEIWARDFDSSVPFTLARFRSGVRFALRNTAVHRPPVQPDPLDSKAEASSGPRAREYGLSGGALWPVESANLFKRLLKNPASSSGSIERIALSPGGGDADQKAEFLGGQVAIVSQTRNGFVQRHKVEVIGRISVYWHRAKHVVVYERTVSPSAQFTPDKGIGSRTRRPVLRKVSEYVELIQRERSYPDFPEAEPIDCGFLRAVGFKSPTINVDSAWSEDVGDFGWKIPLWNRDAARRRPQVYPRPDIGFLCAAAGAGEKPTVTQECLDPDNLFFFADFEAGGNDTDLWASRLSIDYSNQSRPSRKQEADSGDNPDKEGRRLPAAPRIPRGHRRFTWRLAPAASKTAINAGRHDEPIYADLQSITFMRASVKESEPWEEFNNASILLKNLATKVLPLAPWLPDGDAPAPLKDVGDALKAFRAGAASGNEAVVRQAAQDLSREVGKVSPLLEPNRSLADVVEYAYKVGTSVQYKNLKSLITASKQFDKPVPERCDKLADDLVGSLQRKQLLIVENIRSWEVDAIELLQKIAPPPPTIQAIKDKLVEKAIDATKPLFEGVSTDIFRIDDSREKACGIVRDFAADVAVLRERVYQELAEFGRAYDDGKPWGVPRLDAFRAKLDAARLRVVQDVAAAAEEARVRLSTELDELVHGTGAIVSQALAQLAANGSALRRGLEATTQRVTPYLDATIDRLAQLLIKTDGKDKFDLAIDKLEKLEKSAGPYQSDLKAVEAKFAGLRTEAQAAKAKLEALEATLGQSDSDAARAIAKATAIGEGLVHNLDAAIREAADIVGQATHETLRDFRAGLQAASNEIRAGIAEGFAVVAEVGKALDAVVEKERQAIAQLLDDHVFKPIDAIIELASETIERASRAVETLRAELDPQKVAADVLKDQVFKKAIDSAFEGITDAYLTPFGNEQRQRLFEAARCIGDCVEAQFKNFTGTLGAALAKRVSEACNLVDGSFAKALDELRDLKGSVDQYAKDVADNINNLLGGDIEDLIDAAKTLDSDVRRIGNDLSATYASATGYADRVREAAGNLSTGKPEALPGKVLGLYAAVASAPDLPNLSFARDRLAYYYDQASNVIDTSQAEAWFGRLGDELKAMGLSLPFKQLGDRIIPDDLSSLDIGQVFKNFGGLNLGSLFAGIKVPKSAQNAIKLTHAFDKKQLRAWVQIDVDAALAERKSLFTVGPFQLDFVNSRLTGQVRLEAAKDSDKVEQTGRAVIDTDIEAVVSGQPMVTLRKVAIRYQESSGLKVEFDPKNIKLNPVFQFVQDTLGDLFPEELGGMKLIKERGIPVGIEHEFTMPPVDLMFGTSGVSHIQISNHFSLIAYPDFVIADRFSLSKPEMPFLFSIFIIGGTGYITIDTEYRPFRNGDLLVVVEAAAGGSAALGFAFGPVSGSVFITLSVALTYRKLLGTSGGGLTVSLVLLIAGNVNVAGIVDVYIGLLLRMSYRDTGQIDATGTLTLSIRISRFFKISVRANVEYKLRDGRAQTAASVATKTDVIDTDLAEAEVKAKKLLNARSQS